MIVPSLHLIDDLHAFCAKVHLCENFGRPDEISLLDESTSGTVTVLWNSNLMVSKGVLDLVTACERVRADHPSLRLILLGSPMADAEADQDEVLSWLNGLIDSDWISVVGAVPPEVVPSYLASADAVALPSRYASECQPLALIDAMCAGKAVIASDTAAMRATLGDYPSILCASSTEGVITALTTLCSRPPDNSELSAAAARARARFSLERFDRQMASILSFSDRDADRQSR
ncbi:glycosyltransferase family 4 protein [Pseudohaliea sp.]|uniref:glycosyltransferase family 4 protein n=1 Tax=Pseudohaliea sp. TaxID=2740289 RepID=UPI0032F05646